MLLPPHFERRFWAKVGRRGPNDCWLWTAAKDRHGYGCIGLNGRTPAAHRVSWEMANSQSADGLCVLHRCDTPACVNPAHLSLGTHADNLRDMWRKGRGRVPAPVGLPGERNGSAKLTEDEVAQIRELTGAVSQRALARRFGISPAQVCRIQTGKRWAHAA